MRRIALGCIVLFFLLASAFAGCWALQARGNAVLLANVSRFNNDTLESMLRESKRRGRSTSCPSGQIGQAEFDKRMELDGKTRQAQLLHAQVEFHQGFERGAALLNRAWWLGAMGLALLLAGSLAAVAILVGRRRLERRLRTLGYDLSSRDALILYLHLGSSAHAIPPPSETVIVPGVEPDALSLVAFMRARNSHLRALRARPARAAQPGGA